MFWRRTCKVSVVFIRSPQASHNHTSSFKSLLPHTSQAFSSNELAFLSMLFFGVGLYGNLQCLDQLVCCQWHWSDIECYAASDWLDRLTDSGLSWFMCRCLLQYCAPVQGSTTTTPSGLRLMLVDTSTFPTLWSPCCCQFPSSCTSHATSRSRTESELSGVCCRVFVPRFQEPGAFFEGCARRDQKKLSLTLLNDYSWIMLDPFKSCWTLKLARLGI